METMGSEQPYHVESDEPTLIWRPTPDNPLDPWIQVWDVLHDGRPFTFWTRASVLAAEPCGRRVIIRSGKPGTNIFSPVLADKAALGL